MKNFKLKALLAITVIIIVPLSFSYYKIRGKNEDESSLNFTDNNQNGIWDDVEPYIEKNGTNKISKLALQQFFKGLQENLLHPYLPVDLKTFGRDFGCLSKVEDKYHMEFDIDDIENAIISNTSRARAYIHYNKNLSGGFYSLWDERKQGNPCDFEVE